MPIKYLISSTIFLTAISHSIVFAQQNYKPERYSRQYYVCTQMADDLTDTDHMLRAKKDCAAQETYHQDLRLNVAYRNLIHTMTDHEEDARYLPLRNEERAWMKKRDRECAPKDGDGALSLASAQGCVLRMTTDRAIYLESLLSKR